MDRKRDGVVPIGDVAGAVKLSGAPHEFGVFVRAAAELDRARVAVQFSGLLFKILDENVETTLSGRTQTLATKSQC